MCEDKGSALQTKQIVMNVPTLEHMCGTACVGFVEMEVTTRYRLMSWCRYSQAFVHIVHAGMHVTAGSSAEH